jgi:hypothetical protein
MVQDYVSRSVIRKLKVLLERQRLLGLSQLPVLQRLLVWQVPEEPLSVLACP